MFKRFCILVFLFAATLIPVKAEDPIVFAVLFYSPECPHCHDVIENYLPGIKAEYGDQLEILFVNVTTEGGRNLTYSACQVYNVEQCGGVPMMIIGSEVLYGAIEIPARMSEIVQRGLDAGGIGLPNIPGLYEAYEAMLATHHEEDNSHLPDRSSNTSPTLSSQSQSENIWNRLSADPEANAVAIVILIGLLGSLWLVIIQRDSLSELQHRAELFIAGMGMLLALSILWDSEGLATLVAGFVFFGMMALFFMKPHYIIPLIASLGIAVAAYLAHIETTDTNAICGAIGNCNTVQQSAYAKIFGMPIGMIGIVGYAMVLCAWMLTRVEQYKEIVWVGLLGLALAGTIFSAYLTFLEPFVIGATCAWCLMSALIMALILWAVAPVAWDSMQGLGHRHGALSK